MKKKALLTILLASCLTIFVAFTLSGCGNSENEYEGTIDENYDDDEYVEDYPDPYADGMTLEEAKEWEECSVFIMDNNTFYPLHPAYCVLTGTGIASINAASDKETCGLFYTPQEYSGYEIPALSKDAKLVEVRYENYTNEIINLPGKSGLTLPYVFEFENTSFDSPEGNDEYKLTAVSMDDSYDPAYGIPKFADIRAINDTAIDFTNLNNTAIKIGKTNPGMYDEDNIEANKIAMAVDWTSLIESNQLKPVLINFSHHGFGEPGFFSYMIYDAEKEGDVDVSYRESGAVDTEVSSEWTGYRYYNLPTDIKAPKAAKTYQGEYIQTEDGYSIIESAELEPGIYLYNYGNEDSFYVFQVK